MTNLVQIGLFGGLQVELAERAAPITRFRSRNIAALLAYLALKPGQMYTREFLADLLWPDADRDSARNNLRVALSSLRRQLETPGRALPAGAVITAEGRERIGLNDITTGSDVAAFDDLIRQSRRPGSPSAEQQIGLLEKAVQLYQGPLLPGFYDDWVVLRRQQLAQAFQSVLDRLVLLYNEVGDPHRAGEYTDRATMAGPSSAASPAARHDLKDRSHSDRSRPAPPLKAPVFLTRFFGREAEEDALVALFKPWGSDEPASSRERLVTLTGPGGTGKTRLGIQVAERAAPHFPGGVFWVSLIDMTDAAHLADAIVDAVAAATDRAAPPPSWNSLDRAVAALSGGSAASLLALDNFEHLVEEGAALVEQLLARAPNLFCLVTSRQRLLLGIEREVPGLPVPSTTAPPQEPEALIRFAGVRLFIDRCQAARPDFQLTPRNAAAVAALCARLDGLPLALELAAGWSLTLTPEQMLARLEQQQQADLLVARRRDIAPRHQSLQAVLEASYQALDPALQRLLVHLSVFRGTWTAEAAQAVCSAPDHPDILVGLSGLRERSLLLAEEYDGSIRLRMLVTIHAFANALLTGADREAAEARHACYFLDQAEAAVPHLRGGPAQSQWIKTLEADLDNLRAVLARSGAHEAALRLGGALGWFWVVRSHWREGLQWLRQALAESQKSADGSASSARARALYAAAGLASALNRFEECRLYCCESLELCRRVGDTWGAAFSLALLGAIASRQGRYGEGRALLEEGLTAFRQIADPWGTAFALDNLAHACRDQQDYERAAALYTESLSLRKTLEDKQGIAMSLSNLADTEQLRGDWERAAVLHEASLERFRPLGDKAGIGYGLRRLGECALHQGDTARAAALNRESLVVFWELGDRRRIAECLEKTALLREVQGQEEAAVRLLGAAGALRLEIGMPLPCSERPLLERSRLRLKTALGQADFNRLWGLGERMDLQALIAC